jgi:hypothetical protein
MITLSLRRKDLVDIHGTPACEGGLALFDAIKAMQDDDRRKAGKAPRHGLTVTWTRAHQVWAAVAYPGFAAWLRDNGLAPNVSLRGADLSDANLRGADLSGARIAKGTEPPTGWRAVDIGSDYVVTLAKD